MARQLGLRLRAYLLVRTKPRPNKLRLTRQERRHTVRGVYAVRAGTRVDKLRVMLVDDVFATGVTLDAYTRALRQGGAASVLGRTVARAMPAWAAAELAE